MESFRSDQRDHIVSIVFPRYLLRITARGYSFTMSVNSLQFFIFYLDKGEVLEIPE